MKPFIKNLLLLLAGAALVPMAALAQGTALTYQGRLHDATGPASGTYEFQFTVRDALTGGNPVGANPLAATLAVSNGLFTATLDPGAGVFTGADRWLEIALRTNGSGAFTTLAPRQPITAAPYAVFAGGASAAGLTGTLPAASLAGTYGGAVNFSNAANAFAGNAGGLTNLNPANLVGTLPATLLSNAWRIGGNAGTSPGTHFVGTRDEQPLEFKVNNERVLRLEFNTNLTVFGSPSPNLISGHASNQVASGVSGATIAGGGGTNWYGPASPQRVTGEFSTIGGGIGNLIHAPVAVIAGGERGFIGPDAYNSFIGAGAWNSIEGADATLSGGRYNTIQDYAGSISGGSGNTIGAGGRYAAIGGGNANRANGFYASVPGGTENSANGFAATVPGGAGNVAAGSYSFAAGLSARANHSGTFVWADSSGNAVSSTGDNQFLIRAAGGVGIGTTAPGATFEVRTTSATGNAIRFGYYTGGVGNLIAGPSRVAIATGDMVERISIAQGTGNIGLGTLTPSQRLHVIGNILASGTITPNSDVNAKTSFAPVNVADILERVTKLPLQQWRFKTEPAGVQHMGPMAQDFRAAFGLGEIPTAIATVDADGVALAAIQGLNEKVEVRSQKAEDSIQKLQAENAELKIRLERLERLLAQQHGGAR